MKEVEGKVQPIFTKLYQQAGAAGGMPGGMPNGFPGAGAAPQGNAQPKSSGKGPTIEEVD
ncbi:Hypothetical protein EHI5A_066460 [Entamoeba histolytica KU27]|nr:Hypothetical protein EHI5A_066460 [Entamoeba histolytica KU27]